MLNKSTTLGGVVIGTGGIAAVTPVAVMQYHPGHQRSGGRTKVGSGDPRGEGVAANPPALQGGWPCEANPPAVQGGWSDQPPCTAGGLVAHGQPPCTAGGLAATPLPPSRVPTASRCVLVSPFAALPSHFGSESAAVSPRAAVSIPANAQLVTMVDTSTAPPVVSGAIAPCASSAAGHAPLPAQDLPRRCSSVDVVADPSPIEARGRRGEH